jgi:hypothetical protein
MQVLSRESIAAKGFILAERIEVVRAHQLT